MGVPVVFLPGHMCDERLFAPQISLLENHGEVLFFPLNEGSTMADYAQQVLAGVTGNMALVGLSMGGIVAMEVLRQAPDRVERVALMDTNPLPESAEVCQMREELIARVAAGELKTVMRDELKPKYLAQRERRSPILDLCMEMAFELGPDVFTRQSRALQSRPDQQETLRTSSVPALVLCGEEDTLCPLERHQLMAGLIKNSTLEVIPGAGHMPTLEQPDITNRILLEWLDQS